MLKEDRQTPTTHQGVPAARVSISNWRTEPADVERAWESMKKAAAAAAR